ncbi:MAG: GNAT family N-acetyltransferase [Pseudolabrys sp.]|nr:GNAT family N-acetyltransferase [Pseudolabrys sp.]
MTEMADPVTETDTLTIREADRDDLSGVLALYAQPDLDDGVVLSLYDAERIFARFARYPDYTLYVAEQDGRIVGTFALLIMDNLGHLGAPSAIVEDVAVGPVLQGRGVGRAMMRFAMARAGEKHCYKIVLSSNAKRERAHSFYESLGFERHGFSFRIMIEQVTA